MVRTASPGSAPGAPDNTFTPKRDGRVQGTSDPRHDDARPRNPRRISEPLQAFHRAGVRHNRLSVGALATVRHHHYETRVSSRGRHRVVARPARECARFVVCSGRWRRNHGSGNRGARMRADARSASTSVCQEQRPNAYITPELTFEFNYFFAQVRRIWRALVVFPGGSHARRDDGDRRLRRPASWRVIPSSCMAQSTAGDHRSTRQIARNDRRCRSVAIQLCRRPARGARVVAPRHRRRARRDEGAGLRALANTTVRLIAPVSRR